jgi:hypothetical protein
MMSTHGSKKPRAVSPFSTDDAHVVTTLPLAYSQHTTIHTMPPELLSTIFLFYHQDKQERFDIMRYSVYNGPWEIGTVCKNWRATAQCYPALWDVISFCSSDGDKSVNDDFEERIKEGLKRANTAKLDLRLDLTSISLAGGEDVLSLLIPYSSQWAKVTLAFNTSFCRTLSETGYDMSSLHTLNLYYLPDDDDDEVITAMERPDQLLTLFSGASQLKTVYLRNLCPITEVTLPSDALEGLTVAANMDIDTPIWCADPADYNGLNRFVNLRFLDLSEDGRAAVEDMFVSQDPILPEFIFLPQLEMLGISTWDIAEEFILPHLRTPSLRHLRIRQDHGPNCWEKFSESLGRCVDPHGGGCAPSLRRLEIITSTIYTSILSVLRIGALQNVEELSVILTRHGPRDSDIQHDNATGAPKFFGKLFEILTIDSKTPDICCLPNMKYLHTELSREQDAFIEVEMLGGLLVNMIGSRKLTHTVPASASSSGRSVSSFQQAFLRFKRSPSLKPFLSDEVKESLRGLPCSEGFNVAINDTGMCAPILCVAYH